MLAIDFGTTRTKAAHFDPFRGTVDLLRLGRQTPWMPSLVYLSPDATRLFGDDAADMLESDPQRVVRTLKRQLRNRSVRAGDQRATPSELLTAVLAHVRQVAQRQVPAYADAPPRSVVLTLPAAGQSSGAQVEDLLNQAALMAGFTAVHLLTEPEAAAVAWMRQLPSEPADFVVVVLDCGGGTVDWACLRKREGRLGLLAECPPGGDDNTGGEFLDEALLGVVRDKLTEQAAVEALDHLEGRSNWFYAKVRTVREQFCLSDGAAPAAEQRIVVGGRIAELLPTDLRRVLSQQFNDRVCEQLGPYLDSVRQAMGTADVRVLLVGGSANILGLKEALSTQCRCQTETWADGSFAAAMGAAWAFGPVDEAVDTLRMRQMHWAPGHEGALKAAATGHSQPIRAVAKPQPTPRKPMPSGVVLHMPPLADDDGEQTVAVGLTPAETSRPAPPPPRAAPARQAASARTGQRPVPTAPPPPAPATFQPPATAPAPRAAAAKLPRRESRETLEALADLAEQALNKPKTSRLALGLAVATVAGVATAAWAWHATHRAPAPVAALAAQPAETVRAAPASPWAKAVESADQAPEKTATPAAVSPFADVPEGDTKTGGTVRDLVARQAHAVQACAERNHGADGAPIDTLPVDVLVRQGEVRQVWVRGASGDLLTCVEVALRKTKGLPRQDEARQYLVQFRLLPFASGRRANKR